MYKTSVFVQLHKQSWTAGIQQSVLHNKCYIMSCFTESGWEFRPFNSTMEKHWKTQTLICLQFFLHLINVCHFPEIGFARHADPHRDVQTNKWASWRSASPAVAFCLRLRLTKPPPPPPGTSRPRPQHHGRWTRSCDAQVPRPQRHEVNIGRPEWLNSFQVTWTLRFFCHYNAIWWHHSRFLSEGFGLRPLQASTSFSEFSFSLLQLPKTTVGSIITGQIWKSSLTGWSRLKP